MGDEQDARELEWWRTVFSTRFRSDNLPKPGTPLYGYRFELQVEDSTGEPKTWTNRRTT